jgi:hypothetical protein
LIGVRLDPSPKTARSIARTINEKDNRLINSMSNKLHSTSSPKLSIPAWRQSMLLNTTDEETIPTRNDTIYSNVQISRRIQKKDSPIDDEGDLIEHDLLDLVEQEQQKQDEEQQQERYNPPILPAKMRTSTTINQSDQILNIEVESLTRLVHMGELSIEIFYLCLNIVF